MLMLAMKAGSPVAMRRVSSMSKSDDASMTSIPLSARSIASPAL